MPLIVKPNVKNVIINGRFLNGIEGWKGYNGSIEVSNNILSSIGNGVSPSIYPAASNLGIWTLNKKLYSRAKVRVKSADCNYIWLRHYARGMNTVPSIGLPSPIMDQWYNLSGIATFSAGGEGSLYNMEISHHYIDAEAANGKVLEVEEVFAVDLTEAFGIGNEPDLATCDLLFNEWFDGGKFIPELAIPIGNFKNAIKQPKKNLFNPNLVTWLKSDGSIVVTILENGINVKNTSIEDYARAYFIIDLKPGKQYTLAVTSKINSGDDSVSLRDQYGVSLPYTNNDNLSRTFTCPLDGKTMIRFYSTLSTIEIGDVDYTDIQLEEGAIGTEYEPYVLINKPKARMISPIR